MLNYKIQKYYNSKANRTRITILKELKMKPLISILKCEQYLKLSKNEVVRNLYLECMKQSDVLYNQYMNVAR